MLKACPADRAWHSRRSRRHGPKGAAFVGLQRIVHCPGGFPAPSRAGIWGCRHSCSVKLPRSPAGRLGRRRKPKSWPELGDAPAANCSVGPCAYIRRARPPLAAASGTAVLLPDPPPEVGLVRASQRRCHQGIGRKSSEELTVLRDIQCHRDPPRLQELGHGFHPTLGEAFPVALREALATTLHATPCLQPRKHRGHERIVLRLRALARSHCQRRAFQRTPRRLGQWRFGRRTAPNRDRRLGPNSIRPNGRRPFGPVVWTWLGPRRSLPERPKQSRIVVGCTARRATSPSDCWTNGW